MTALRYPTKPRPGDRESALRALSGYAPEGAVLDVDRGHTDPHSIVLFGGQVRVDAIGRRVLVTCWRSGRPPPFWSDHMSCVT
ncbi:hypothetical protein ABT025_11765 [Streptomyces sp. NPDC002809]|uniref:hypothetical protein n=1 Tax=Streptomyces sp. NPDC002809 TaxID=3154433 RepID=UPI00332FE503